MRLDLVKIQEIGIYFYQVRKKYHQYETDYTGVDTPVQVNQVPGGQHRGPRRDLSRQGHRGGPQGAVGAPLPR